MTRPPESIQYNNQRVQPRALKIYTNSNPCLPPSEPSAAYGNSVHRRGPSISSSAPSRTPHLILLLLGSPGRAAQRTVALDQFRPKSLRLPRRTTTN
ncbi:putative pollen-specific leucine-rich repeat extensin-like protein 3 [Iris pallida]|uniref:Pollen-specific leucine-rich repeat extensin-like protein 3 n=1 Tax=Iris pallida TaxID=29817 RepID=A0AAX6GW07_IRIPA|nr:putative pollen-specific leucine-rich repeat extensin-like protein 3 [Iris pallida]